MGILGKEEYFVYCVLLYFDDFTPDGPVFQRGSFGGCYMLPLGPPYQRKKSVTSIRTICLALSGIYTNIVLV